MIFEPGRTADSGVVTFYRGPSEEFKRLDDREPLFVNASTRLGFGPETPLRELRVTKSDPKIEASGRRLPAEKSESGYEPRLDYVENPHKELPAGEYNVTHIWIERGSFETGQLHIFDRYQLDAFKAFSLFPLENQESAIVVNDGNLHLLVRPSEQDRFYEYLKRGATMAAHHNYTIYAGLSPVQPGFGIQLSSF